MPLASSLAIPEPIRNTVYSLIDAIAEGDHYATTSRGTLLALSVLFPWVLIGAIGLLTARGRARRTLHDKVGASEARDLVGRQRSGFSLGSFILGAGSSHVKDDEDDDAVLDAAELRRRLERDLQHELNAAPGHLHPLTRPARLVGSSDNLLVPETGDASGNSGTGSSASSVLSDIDPDIFLDREGFDDLKEPRHNPSAASPRSGLTPVTERLSEETLDDCHAFQDVVVPGGLVKRDSFDARGGRGGGEEGGEAALGLESVVEEEEGGDGNNNNNTNIINGGSPQEKSLRANDALFDLLNTVSSPEEMDGLRRSKRELEASISETNLFA